MVIDTSALLAILLAEPEAERFAQAIAGDPRRLVSALSAFEAAIVILSRKGPAGVRELDLLIHSTAISLVSFDEEQVQLARKAYEQYGKGRHPAALNLGDCSSYALARTSGEPLLCKGNDFLGPTSRSGPLTGPDPRSARRLGAAAAWHPEIRDPLVSVWPAVVEAMYLLSFSWQAQKALWEILEIGGVLLLPLDEADVQRMKQLMEKYRDPPMDMADAALVHVAEREGLRRVLTLDQRDFSVYRPARKGSFTLLP